MIHPGAPARRRKNPDDGSEDTDILDGMARALWVTSYADWVDNLADEDDRDELSPGPGGDWDDAAPETPDTAYEAASDLYLLIDRANGEPPGELFQRACQVDGCERNEENAVMFGHYLAMQSLGHGVSWFDDHKEFPLKFPRGFEASYDGIDVWWSPQVRSRENPVPMPNPAWVTSILSKHYVQLEEQVPPQWLPKLTKPSASRGKITAAMKEYGCGAYGCVLPTLDSKVVLKLTTDETEAQFANDFADKLTVPVVVKYHLTRALPEKYKNRQSFLLWRDSADHVGKVEQAIAEEGGTDPVVTEQAINAQHQAAQDAYNALYEGEPAEDLLRKWEDATHEMGLMVPELSELAEGMITNLHNDKIFFGDVHSGNIGRVDGRWVVVDPGHVAVLSE